MSEELDIQEEASEGVTPMQRMKGDLRAVWKRLSYHNMVSNVPFLLYVTALGVIYIGMSHASVERQRTLNRQQDELKELRWQQMDLQARLMNAATETELIRRGSIIGLKPLTLPAYSLGAEEKEMKIED